MSSTQDLILDRITELVEAQGFTVTNDRQFANTGVLRSLDRLTLTQVASVPYNFQTGYVHFGSNPNYVAALWFNQPRRPGTAEWVCESIPELINTVVAHLTMKGQT